MGCNSSDGGNSNQQSKVQKQALAVAGYAKEMSPQLEHVLKKNRTSEIQQDSLLNTTTGPAPVIHIAHTSLNK